MTLSQTESSTPQPHSIQPPAVQTSPEIQMLLRIEKTLNSIDGKLQFFVVITALSMLLGGCGVFMSIFG